jgi:hypothetical protein
VLPRLAVTALLLLLAACTGGAAEEDGPVDVRRPELGACRLLTPADINETSNDSAPVDCAKRHTAETFAVGTFPDHVGDEIDDPALGAHVFEVCERKFRKFLGGNESLVMRAMVTWAWFRPTEEQWDEGARWWRCDVVGGGEESTELVNLPESAAGLLLGRPDDRWMVCVNGPSIAEAAKIPCSRKHTWRAVTTIVLGEEKDPYPGDRLVEVRTRDYCSDSVGAWHNSPVDYDFGFTWYHAAVWKAGNRRSICWARTDQ